MTIAVLDGRTLRFVWAIVFQEQQIGDCDTAFGDNSLFRTATVFLMQILFGLRGSKKLVVNLKQENVDYTDTYVKSPENLQLVRAVDYQDVQLTIVLLR